MRRITEQLAQLTGGWRGLPVTLGFLAAIIAASVAVWQARGGVTEDMGRAITKEIAHHDGAGRAHPPIQKAGEGCCNELRGRVRQLEAQLQEVGRKRRRR